MLCKWFSLTLLTQILIFNKEFLAIYKIMLTMDVKDEEFLSKLEYYCNNAPRLQEETLEAILKHNAQVDYMLKQGLNARTDIESFKQCIPLTTYSDYTHEIQRIAHGEKSPILSPDPLLCMFFSSGTTSQQPKLIPYFDSDLSRCGSHFVRQIAAASVRKIFPPRHGSKSLSFMYAGKIMETKGGIKAMAATAYSLRNSQNQNMISMYISPPQVFLGSDAQQQMYCHLLCGLRLADAIDNIKAPYAYGLLKAFHLLESQWQQLCEDIKNGYISPTVVTDIEMRKIVEDQILGGPKPEIAERVQKECSKGEWRGIVGRLWPNARYLSCVMTGSMEQYYSQIRHYAGDVSLLGGDFLASECAVGVNLDRIRPPQETLFTIVPTVAYYEFILVNDNEVPNTDIATVDLCNVEVGKMYEVVATTYRGLYRYRLGDIVRIRGFYGHTPQVEYISKVCNSADIVNEKQLMDVMQKIGQIFLYETQMEIVDFACHADYSSPPKRIQLFWELKELKDGPSLEEPRHYEKVFKRYCLLVDECLNEYEYIRMERINKNLNPSELCVVREGSFDAIMEVAMQKGTTASQYKPPRIIRNVDILNVLRTATLIKVS